MLDDNKFLWFTWSRLSYKSFKIPRLIPFLSCTYRYTVAMCHYLVATSPYLVLTSRYFSLLTRYFRLLLVTYLFLVLAWTLFYMARDLCNNSTALIPRFQNKAALCYTSQIFLSNVIFWIYYLHSFILYLFYIFLYKRNFVNKLKASPKVC